MLTVCNTASSLRPAIVVTVVLQTESNNAPAAVKTTERRCIAEMIKLFSVKVRQAWSVANPARLCQEKGQRACYKCVAALENVVAQSSNPPTLR